MIVYVHKSKLAFESSANNRQLPFVQFIRSVVQVFIYHIAEFS